MKKKERKLILNKYGGLCAYCGDELQKGWHVDEMRPIKRNFKFNYDKTKFVPDGTCMFPENLNIDNQMPACPSCNINKHSMNIEEFRAFIQHFIVTLNRDSVQYKVAKRYGLIKETAGQVVFYFERLNDE